MGPIKHGVVGNFRQTGINLSGLIQGVVMKEKNPICVFSKTKCFQDNNKPAHWVGPSKLRYLNIDQFFKITPNFDEKEASVTGKKRRR